MSDSLVSNNSKYTLRPSKKVIVSRVCFSHICFAVLKSGYKAYQCFTAFLHFHSTSFTSYACFSLLEVFANNFVLCYCYSKKKHN